MSIQTDVPPSDERSVAVRLRDHEQCQACNRTRSEVRDLDVHQIVPTERAANQLSNYILLCRECHERAHETEMEGVE
jgi:5-methylcytosine-specific restriction endonuclease McrA